MDSSSREVSVHGYVFGFGLPQLVTLSELAYLLVYRLGNPLDARGLVSNRKGTVRAKKVCYALFRVGLFLLTSRGKAVAWCKAIFIQILTTLPNIYYVCKTPTAHVRF